MSERAGLVSVLKARLEFCPYEYGRYGKVPADPPRYAGHSYDWTPLEGAEVDRLSDTPRKGRFLVRCGKGCGYEREVTLTGEEVWIA